MKVIFYPSHSDSNDYVKLATEALETNGCEIINRLWNGDFKLILFSLLEVIKNKELIFHFNWLEDNASKKGFLPRIKCELLLLFMSLFYALGGRLVWTMHNAKSHNDKCSYQRKFIKRMLKRISLVVVHCSESISLLNNQYGYSKEQILFVPHGNYCNAIDAYLHDINNLSNEVKRVRFVYFGTVSPYKGVETLIKAFDCNDLRGNAELYICGKPNSEELKGKIEEKANNIPEIHLDMRFLSNRDLCDIISKCDVAVLPYDKESMQNSGSAIMALTCGKAIIIPLFGYIKDIADKGFVFSYDYSNEQERIYNLRIKMQEFCKKIIDQPDYGIILGRQAREFAKSELDWSYIMKTVSNRYSQLFKV